MGNNADWLASNKTWKKWTTIGVGELLSYAGIDFKKPTDEERLVKERKNCQNVITKLNYQFMDLTDKGLFLMSVKKSGQIGSTLQSIITENKKRFFDSH